MKKTIYEDSVKTSKIYNNTDQNLIIITEDKLNNILKDYCSNLKMKDKWGTPLGISLTILATLVTANFHKTFGLDPAIWKDIFNFSFAAALLWLIKTCYRNWKTDTSLKSLMRSIKNEK